MAIVNDPAPSSSPRGAQPILRVADLCKRFAGAHASESKVAFDGLTFDVADGEFLSLIGPSGCGKTTLLRCIDGLIPVDGGTVSVAGQPVDGPGDDRAMVFQSFALLPWGTVERNIGFPLQLRGVPREERRRLVSEIIGLVGLRGSEHSYPHMLSGGMQQRVGLARALVANPRLLLLDEPFGALDAQTRRQLQDELLSLWERDRKTIVLVTHDMEEATYLSDRVLVLGKGPTKVEKEILVDLPRPRSEATRQDPRFAELVDTIWESLRSLS